MQRLEVSGTVRPIYGSLGVKRLTSMAVRAIYRGKPDAIMCMTLSACGSVIKLFEQAL